MVGWNGSGRKWRREHAFELGAYRIMRNIVNEGGVAAKKESRWLLASGLR